MRRLDKASIERLTKAGYIYKEFGNFVVTKPERHPLKLYWRDLEGILYSIAIGIGALLFLPIILIYDLRYFVFKIRFKEKE